MEPQNPVKVRVTDPQTDPSKNFITYLIIGNDELGTFEIRRRFNDFFYLRQCLRKRWPALYIPPIPQKKINLSKDEHKIQYRRKFFEYFLKQLASFHHLFYCTITQQFLRNKSTQMEKYYQTVGQPKTCDLVKQYKDLFPNIKTHDQVQLKNISNNFYAYLKKAEKQVKSMGSQMEAIAEARQAFLENLNNCNTNILPEYQKNVYIQYFQGSQREPMQLFLQDHKVQDNIRNLRDNSVNKPNSFGILFDAMIFEAREIQAFQETILSKQNIQNTKKKLQQKCLSSQSEISKLMGGKFSLKSVFSKGSKNEQIHILQKQIPEMQKQIEQLNQLCNVTNAIVSEIEIPKFKKCKKHQYYNNLSQIGQSQLIFLAAYGDLMKSVMDGLNKHVIKT